MFIILLFYNTHCVVFCLLLLFFHSLVLSILCYTPYRHYQKLSSDSLSVFMFATFFTLTHPSASPSSFIPNSIPHYTPLLYALAFSLYLSIFVFFTSTPCFSQWGLIIAFENLLNYFIHIPPSLVSYTN
jgi:hypothetical protein